MEKKIKILLADRNGNVRRLLRKEFESEGYKVKTAANGAELMIIPERDDSLDLLLIDPDLPIGGGITIIERLKNGLPQLPVIIHSANTGYAKPSVISNAEAFIEKSGNLKELKKAVADVIGKNYQKEIIFLEELIRYRTKFNKKQRRRSGVAK